MLLVARAPSSTDPRTVSVQITGMGRTLLKRVARAGKDFNDEAGLGSEVLRAALIEIIRQSGIPVHKS